MKKTAYVSPIIGTVGDEQDTSLHGGGNVLIRVYNNLPAAD